MPISLFFASMLTLLSGWVTSVEEPISLQSKLWHTYTAEDAVYDQGVDQAIGRQLSRLTFLNQAEGQERGYGLDYPFDAYPLQDGESIYAFSDCFRIKSRSGDLTTTFSIKAQGVNQLMQISSITLESQGSKSDYQATTDWIGPYIVRSTAGDTTQEKGRFTGGWHGSNGDGSGKPTALTKSAILYAKGLPLNNIKIGFTKEVALCVVNHIYAYNNSQPVLEETIWYTFPECGIKVQTTIKPLTPILIERYYGLQTQNRLFNRTVSYVYEDGQTETVDIGIDSQSEMGRNLDYLEFLSEDKGFKMNVALDRVVLNDKPYNFSKSQPSAFTKSYGKSYFNLINGQPLLLVDEDLFQWAGSYTFQLHK